MMQGKVIEIDYHKKKSGSMMKTTDQSIFPVMKK